MGIVGKSRVEVRERNEGKSRVESNAKGVNKITIGVVDVR
jgi:hypothetical protein